MASFNTLLNRKKLRTLLKQQITNKRQMVQQSIEFRFDTLYNVFTVKS